MTDPNGSFGDIIEKTINYGREDHSSKLIKIQQQFDSKYKNFTHASHVMIYAKTKLTAFDTIQCKAFILMQMRSDGYIGFPGGFAEENEKPVEAVCREVKEELGWSEEKGAISDSNYLFTHVDEDKEYVMHFFVTEVTEAKLLEIERNSFKAPDYGTEVLGYFRVPLYTLGDGFKGFPSFLRNHFAGNSKLQLIEAILNLNLLTEEQIIQALYSAPNITK